MARHALPDPSYHPVRAADSQHTLDCKTLGAAELKRSAFFYACADVISSVVFGLRFFLATPHLVGPGATAEASVNLHSTADLLNRQTSLYK